MRLFLYAFVALFLSLLPARAGEAEDRSAIRQVIEAQIAALRADDASAAYSYAAPNIQKIFPNPDIFMTMVRNGYKPVYRPQQVTFGRFKAMPDGGYGQEVFLIDSSGKPYTALYTAERQADGSWKISSCRIIESVGAAA